MRDWNVIQDSLECHSLGVPDMEGVNLDRLPEK